MTRWSLVLALVLGCAGSDEPLASPRRAPSEPPPAPAPSAAASAPQTEPPGAPTAEVPSAAPVASAPAQPRPCLEVVIGLALKNNIDGPGWPNLARATARAQKDHDEAAAIYDRDPGRAAKRFMDCASRFLASGIEDRELAQSNARACYMNAAGAFAKAKTFATEGRAAIERAAKADKANAEWLREYLTKGPDDCG